ncbi:methyltransferase [Candidatus Bipolaricaulota bacterium]|nr:methyltransferase [Candidatus Bipolaricaulota bacterium]
MDHRERVLKSLNHREADRVPIDIGGTRSTGIHSLAYRKLREYLGWETGSIKLYDVCQQLAEIDRDILEKFDADVVSVNRLSPSYGIRIDEWKKGQLVDGSTAVVPQGFDPVREGDVFKIKNEEGKTVATRSKDSLYYDSVGIDHPLAEAETVREIENKFPTREITDDEREYLYSNARSYREETDYAIISTFGGSLYEASQGLRGPKQWYLDLAKNEKIVNKVLDLLLEQHLKNLKTFVEVLGKNIDIVVFGGDDLGMQDRPQISPETYRKYFKSRHKEMWDYVKEHTNWKIFLHSCGSIYKLLPDLIEAGVDIINPVQINAKGMEPKRLKHEFGEEIVFWGGGCDTQNVLPKGTTKEVIEEVKKNIDIFAPGGGFVFTPVHNIQPDVSPEKIVTLYETAREYGVY